MLDIKIYLNKKFAGNALLLILIISVVMVAILLSISDRLINTEFSIARTSEYERSLLYSEGFINNIVSLYDNIQFKNCISNTVPGLEFTDISGCFNTLGGVNLDNQQLKVYAKAAQDNRVSISRGQTLILRLVESLGNPQNAPIIGNVVANIQNCGNNGLRDFIFTRVGWYNNRIIVGKYRGTKSTIPHISWIHVVDKRRTPNQPSYPTLYISARYIGTSANCQIGFDVYNNSNNQVIASTRSLEILLQSNVYLGANSLVYFRLPTGGRTLVTDNIYDYVYFEQ